MEAGILLGSGDRRQRGLAQAEAAVEHDVFQSSRPLVRRIEHRPQRLFQVALADEVLQRFGTEVPPVGKRLI